MLRSVQAHVEHAGMVGQHDRSRPTEEHRAALLDQGRGCCRHPIAELVAEVARIRRRQVHARGQQDQAIEQPATADLIALLGR